MRRLWNNNLCICGLFFIQFKFPLKFFIENQLVAKVRLKIDLKIFGKSYQSGLPLPSENSGY